MSGIGLLNEKPLHASLKQWYARPGDRFEVPVDGYVIDLSRAAASALRFVKQGRARVRLDVTGANDSKS